MSPLPLAFRAFALTVTAAIVYVVVGPYAAIPSDEWPQLLLLFSMIVSASLIRGSSPRGTSFTPTTVLTYLSVYVFNVPTAALVIGASRCTGFALARGWIPWRAIFNGSQAGLSAALGAYVFYLLGGDLRGAIGPTDYYAALLAPLANHLANNFFVSLAASLTRGTPWAGTWAAATRELLWPNVLSIPTALVLALLYVRVHYLVTLGYLALLPLQWMALRLYVKRKDLYEQIIDGLVAAADANFPMARGHARRVADISVAVAKEMRLGELTVESVQRTALLHDIGMIGMDDVLEKSLITQEDAVGLHDHVSIGADLVRQLRRRDVLDGILHHHERYDGTGYPEGLAGTRIPLLARIVALAEAVDSLSLTRGAEQRASSIRDILEYVRSERGRAFDPVVVDAFFRVVEKGGWTLTNWRAH